ncbi:YcjF family protein [Methylomicrobium lacus]|uniref:YcjF family protein n=1 Tax=Methylomicrobium lacus TaxID=136992 RepID=UPI0035A8ADCA
MVNDDRIRLSRSRSRKIEQQQLRRRALKIVNRHTWLSGGMGLIPTPLLYQAAVGGLLGKMLYDLCGLYGTSMTRQKNKAIVASVLGGAHSEWISVYLGSSIRKILPGLAAIGHPVIRPVVAAGVTYSIGKLFIQHFESGAWLQDAAVSSVSDLPVRQRRQDKKRPY